MAISHPKQTMRLEFLLEKINNFLIEFFNYEYNFIYMKKFLVLSLIIFIPVFIFNQEEFISEGTHYYLKEWINEDGLKEACLLEGDSIPPESIPEGFVKVSLEELHQKGYKTSKEWLEALRAIPETVYLDQNH